MPEEKITAIIPLREYEEGKYLFMATEKGLVKKTPIQDYAKMSERQDLRVPYCVRMIS